MLFLELVARQFSITSVHDRVRIKTAVAFAMQLSVHVNYLNKSVKSVTGQTTTDLVAAHLAAEDTESVSEERIILIGAF